MPSYRSNAQSRAGSYSVITGRHAAPHGGMRLRNAVRSRALLSARLIANRNDDAAFGMRVVNTDARHRRPHRWTWCARPRAIASANIAQACRELLQ